MTFNSNYDATTQKTVGDFTISGGGSLFKSNNTITFGNVSRNPVNVNLKLSDTGFGKIQAANITMGNGAYVFDASQPFSVITDYVPGQGVLLLDVTGTLTGFTDPQTSGVWTAALSENGKQVWATQNISGLAYTVDGGTLEIPDSAAKKGNFELTSNSDPFRLVFDLKGLTDLSQTEALAAALVSWDFDALDAQFAGVQMLGVSGNSVPEPGTWLILTLGALGLLLKRGHKTWKK